MIPKLLQTWLKLDDSTTLNLSQSEVTDSSDQTAKYENAKTSTEFAEPGDDDSDVMFTPIRSD